jgi:hypothetical protein
MAWVLTVITVIFWETVKAVGRVLWPSKWNMKCMHCGKVHVLGEGCRRYRPFSERKVP